MNSAWFEDVSHPAQNFKSIKEEKEEWKNFYAFYKEVVANKHLWKREMLAITYIDVAQKYGYVGLEVIHPYEDRLINYFSGDYNNTRIAQINMDRYGRQVSSDFGDTIFNNYQKDCDQQLESFLKKFPEIKLAHSSTVFYKAENIKIIKESFYDPNLHVFYEQDEIRYNLVYEHKKNKLYEKFLKETNELVYEELYSKNYGYRSSSCCYFCAESFPDLFCKLHESLPKELIQGNFIGLEKAQKNLAKNKKKFLEKHKKEIKKLEEKRKAERQAAAEYARKQRLKSKLKPKPKDSLYLMKNNRDGRYKIGISKDPKHRESTLQSQEPDVVLVGSWDQLAKHEKSWHDYFSEWRQRGEWFDLEAAQVRFMVDKCLNKKGPPKRKKINEETLENLG